MNYTQQAIEKAIEGGWEEKIINGEKIHSVSVGNNFWWISKIFRKSIWMYVIKIELKESDIFIPFHATLLNPLFWQALGKVEGWAKNEESYICKDCGVIGISDSNHMNDCPTKDRKLYWRVYWHRLIDHLAEGKDPETFFERILANK